MHPHNRGVRFGGCWRTDGERAHGGEQGQQRTGEPGHRYGCADVVRGHADTHGRHGHADKGDEEQASEGFAPRGRPGHGRDRADRGLEQHPGAHVGKDPADQEQGQVGRVHANRQHDHAGGLGKQADGPPHQGIKWAGEGLRRRGRGEHGEYDHAGQRPGRVVQGATDEPRGQ